MGGIFLLHVTAMLMPKVRITWTTWQLFKKFLQCHILRNLNEVCDYASRNDYSYWLQYNRAHAYDDDTLLKGQIWRNLFKCAVCETPD